MIDPKSKEKRKPLTTDLAVKKAACLEGKPVTRYSCGGNGLFLDVKRGGARSWVLCIMIQGKRLERGLGSYPQVGIGEARDRAILWGRQLREGNEIGPRKLAALRVQEKDSKVTFEDAAHRYLAKLDRENAFKSALNGDKGVHRKQWDYTLKEFVFPAIGTMDVNEIRISHLTPIFEPIWKTKYSTASKTRQRVALVLDYAVDQGWRNEELMNPARHKSTTFKKPKEYETKHHAAVPREDMPAFMRKLRAFESVSAAALEFTILTAVRTSETRAAKWSEIDLESRMWIIPAERMKARKPHRVPLSTAAIAILGRMKALRGYDGWVFPGHVGARGEGCLSNMAQLACLKAIRPDATVHGFRSTFRDWAISAGIVEEVRAACSAHTKKDKVQAAYERADFFDQRVPVMQKWADFLGTCSLLPEDFAAAYS